MTDALIDRTPPREIAGIVIPTIGDAADYDPSRQEETEGLVDALGVELAFSETLRVRKPNAGKLFGGGQLDALRSRLAGSDATMLIVDAALSPIQQRNLERDLKVKIVDRTGLILEIFGLRARSAEGRLQVEMARLLYERSRLVRTWTHLERQRGGVGFLAGPGESQLEADRRMLDRRIAKFRRELEDVRRTRKLQRSGRQRRGAPVVALVGYTNAGKSTLFNRLADASVMAADMPFATLDPTARDIELPSGRKVALIDTVGFISDLPTHLVASFRATVEAAMEADLLLHVRDISHPETDRQADDVDAVLEQLEGELDLARPPTLEAWNKSDLLGPDMRAGLAARAARSEDDAVIVSAANGDGVDDLLKAIEARLFRSRRPVDLYLAPSEGKARAWLHEHCEVETESTGDDGAFAMTVLMSSTELARFQKIAPGVSEALKAHAAE
ncbi:MAG: GTPase HflX [Pseudomonadota bacterium]